MAVIAIWTNGRQLTAAGATRRLRRCATGKPVDSKEYAENRRKLMEQIRQRQMALAKKSKADEMKNLPPPPPGATAPAAPAPAPSAKK